MKITLRLKEYMKKLFRSKENMFLFFNGLIINLNEVKFIQQEKDKISYNYGQMTKELRYESEEVAKEVFEKLTDRIYQKNPGFYMEK